MKEYFKQLFDFFDKMDKQLNHDRYCSDAKFAYTMQVPLSFALKKSQEMDIPPQIDTQAFVLANPVIFTDSRDKHYELDAIKSNIALDGEIGNDLPLDEYLAVQNVFIKSNAVKNIFERNSFIKDISIGFKKQKTFQEKMLYVDTIRDNYDIETLTAVFHSSNVFVLTSALAIQTAIQQYINENETTISGLDALYLTFVLDNHQKPHVFFSKSPVVVKTSSSMNEFGDEIHLDLPELFLTRFLSFENFFAKITKQMSSVVGKDIEQKIDPINAELDKKQNHQEVLQRLLKSTNSNPYIDLMCAIFVIGHKHLEFVNENDGQIKRSFEFNQDTDPNEIAEDIWSGIYDKEFNLSMGAQLSDGNIYNSIMVLMTYFSTMEKFEYPHAWDMLLVLEMCENKEKILEHYFGFVDSINDAQEDDFYIELDLNRYYRNKDLITEASLSEEEMTEILLNYKTDVVN